jgi:hypothetical protein
MASKPRVKRPKSTKIGRMEAKVPKIKSTKVSSAPKVSYVLRKDHANPTKLA